jgi:hypothetical protein
MRKGFDGLAAIVQQELAKDPFGGQLFVFRGKRGDLLKILAGTAKASPVLQTAGAGPLRLAKPGHGPSPPECRRTRHAGRGDRLARPAPDRPGGAELCRVRACGCPAAP